MLEMELLDKSAGWQRATRSFQVDALNVRVYNTLDDLAADTAHEVNEFLRATLREMFGDSGAAAPILYGGSVKPVNAGDILKAREVGGALVGGASLKAADFLAIIEAA